jgi:hypothetical protein
MSQQTTVRAPVPTASSVRTMYWAWPLLALLSLCLGLPALAVGTLWSQLLLSAVHLTWLNDTTIGSFGGAAFAALVMGTILVGCAVGIAQGFVLQHTLRTPIRAWGAWLICTTIGWSSGLCAAALASMPLGRYLYQTLDRPLVPLIEGGLIGLGGGCLVGILQWFVLRHTVKQAGYWILTTVIGWIVGWIVFWSVLDGFFSNWSIS